MKYEITKGSEKDFDGAPKWAIYLVKLIDLAATAWVSGGDDKYQYKSDEDGQIGYEIKGVFIKWEWSKGVEIIAERRPITALVWDGQGIPPVGTEVMSRTGKAVIDYCGTGVIVFTNAEGQWSISREMMGGAIKPIRSTEDAARDEAVSAMLDIFGKNAATGTTSAIKALYDAGYRKME